MQHIGIFDSGMGGLSVYTKCKAVMPNSSFLYLDDGSNFPYGDKGEDFVIERALHNVRLLNDSGASAVVVACNTATAVAIEVLRREFSGIIVGIEPAIMPAIRNTTGKVLVLATPLTCKALKGRYDIDRIDYRPQPKLAQLIESNFYNVEKLKQIALEVTDGDYESVVLGCTHYSFLTPHIQKKVFDGVDGVANRLKSLLVQ